MVRLLYYYSCFYFVSSALFDACNRGVEKGWSIGISRSDKGEQIGGHLYFTHTNTRITSHQPYKQNQWTHVSSSFDGKDLKLYINGAQVARGKSQNQVLYQTHTAKCKELRLGGVLKNRNYFRGSIYNFRLWNYALGHHEVVKFMKDFSDIKYGKHLDLLIAADNFHDIKQWRSLFQRVPVIIHSEKPLSGYSLVLTTPQCGKTVCDDPDVIKSYTKHWEQRRPKKIRYRIINIMNDDGSDPIISKDQIRRQHQALNRAFAPYNITWKFDLVEMKNSSLRMRNIMYGCDPTKFGNDICESECQSCESNNDGGDCDTLEQPCRPDEIGNGHCDAGCNRHYHHWDGGDCCVDGSIGACLDPSSTNR